MQNKNHSIDGARNARFSQRSADDKPVIQVTSPRFEAAGSCDISEVVTIPPVDADSSNSLPPLASEMFKQELYIRGYLKRPTNRPSNPRSRLVLMFANRNVFPKLLGRWQGRKVAKCIEAEQDTAEPSELDTPDKHLSISASSASLRTPHADTLDSPWRNTNTTPSDSYDLHEFSYLTAFTTPPSSPSMIVDAETLGKGVNLGDIKHAV